MRAEPGLVDAGLGNTNHADPGLAAGELPSDEAFDTAMRAAFEDGRTLLRAHESAVAHESPSLLATSCRSSAVDEAVRKITLFAFALSAVISAMAAFRIIPLAMLGILVVWLSVAAVARLAARQRRAELGETLLELELGEMLFRPIDGKISRRSLRGVSATSEPALEGDGAAWLMLRHPDGRAIRLCRGPAREVDRVIVVLRQNQLPVLVGHRAVTA